MFTIFLQDMSIYFRNSSEYLNFIQDYFEE